MTTNHRPTLENKRGRRNDIGDSIQHSRAQKSHASLKLRLDIQGTKIDPVASKRAIAELGEPNKRHKLINSDEVADEVETSGNARSTDSGQASRSDSEQDFASSSEDDESDSEAEALRAELQSIREEKEREKQRMLQSNPLLNPSKDKKSWRSLAFGKKLDSKATKGPAGQEYTTDTLHSKTNRDFLSKYVR